MTEYYRDEDEYEPQRRLEPHRGALVLVMGILGIVFCTICGIVAWVIGNNDIASMDAGRMDDTGRGLTQAGRILGIVSVVLVLIGILIAGFMFLVVLGAGASGY